MFFIIPSPSNGQHIMLYWAKKIESLKKQGAYDIQKLDEMLYHGMVYANPGKSSLRVSISIADNDSDHMLLLMLIDKANCTLYDVKKKINSNNMLECKNYGNDEMCSLDLNVTYSFVDNTNMTIRCNVSIMAKETDILTLQVSDDKSKPKNQQLLRQFRESDLKSVTVEGYTFHFVGYHSSPTMKLMDMKVTRYRTLDKETTNTATPRFSLGQYIPPMIILKT